MRSKQPCVFELSLQKPKPIADRKNLHTLTSKSIPVPNKQCKILHLLEFA